MATWEEVRRIALALPEAAERSSRGIPEWRVKDKLFAWERPLRRADLATLGDTAPEGAILAARVPDVGVKDALLAEDAATTTSRPSGPACRPPGSTGGTTSRAGARRQRPRRTSARTGSSPPWRRLPPRMQRMQRSRHDLGGITGGGGAARPARRRVLRGRAHGQPL